MNKTEKNDRDGVPPYLNSRYGSGVLLPAGERLIDSAADIARRRGDGHRLYDSVLINVIREMSATEIKEAIR